MKVSILLYHNTSDYRDIFAAILLTIFLVMNYLNNKSTRSQYLLTKKDLRWQQYMPSIIEKPYFIIEYNQTLRSFKSIEQQLLNFIDFQQSHDHTLRLFLRKAQTQNMTLEQYLFKQQLSSHPEENILSVIYNKKLITIKLYDLNIKNNQYLLIINVSQSKAYDLHKLHYSHMLSYAKFIRINMNIARTSFDKVRSQIMNNLFLSSSVLFSTQVTTVNLTRIIKKLSTMYKLGYKINIMIISDNDIYLHTFRSQLFGFLNYLFLLLQSQYLKQLQCIKLILEDLPPCTVQVKICVVNLDIFREGYNQLKILKKLEPILLLSPISKDLELIFVRDMQQSFQTIPS